jgi:hypothetical protein
LGNNDFKMPITNNIDTFVNNYHKGNGSDECPVCYEIIKKDKGVKCCNGHACCERHFIERAKSMYESGDRAFGDSETTSQRCFICRCDMHDDLFSVNYLKLLNITQVFCMGKYIGKTDLECHDIYKKLSPLMDECPSLKIRGDPILDTDSDSDEEVDLFMYRIDGNTYYFTPDQLAEFMSTR